MELLVTGGYEDGSGECFVDRVDPSGRRERVVSFTPPETHRVPNKGFTGAAWLDGDLLVCSFDAVWRFGQNGKLLGRIHQPDANDLHDVAVLANGRIAVCNTGLDAVDLFDADGRFVGRCAFTPAWFEAERQRGFAVDRADFPQVLRAGWSSQAMARFVRPEGGYYSGADAQPFHRRKVRDYLHPNRVVEFAGRLAVTMLATCEVRCARSFERLAEIPGHPHDGVVLDGRLFVTTTDGRIVAVCDDGSLEVVVDTAHTGHSGWCRGLAVARDCIAVGLSEIRRSPRFTWKGPPFRETETSVLWLDRSGSLQAQVDLTDRERQSKVFTLLEPISGWR